MPHLLEIRTVQAVAMKTLVETLKELLSDTVLIADQQGVRVVAMDSKHVVLVHVRLDAKKFEFYHVTGTQHLAVNMLNLYKLIKTVSGTDTLSMYVEEAEPNILVAQIDKNDHAARTVYRLSLLDMEFEDLNIPPERFPFVVTLNSADFQKICRDMSHISDVVDIKVVRGEVTFSCRGDFCSQETTFGNDCIHAVQPDDPDPSPDITQGVFPLKYLVTITRCTSLASQVELFFKNNYPLIVRYAISTLGEIKLACAHRIQRS